MEWMLQVVDELDDALGTVWHGCVDLRSDVALLLLSVASAVRLRDPAPRVRS